jgi:two-component sensor histidine kinase
MSGLTDVTIPGDPAHGDPESPAVAILTPNAQRGMVVIHEIFGRQPEIDRVVHRFADAGYAVVAPDLFFDGRIACLRAVIHAMKQAEEQIRLLMNEVNHRSKNLLSVVTAIAQQTAASSPQEFVKKFSNRVQALAVNHDLLVKSQWRSIGASELIAGQLAHFGDLVGKRVLFDGPPIRVSSAAAQAIGMVVHELSTNTVKCGALSGEEGRIDIGWEIDSQGAEPVFSICWTESGGPPIMAPTHRGFGTTVVTKMVEMSLDGQTVLEYSPSGLIWRLACPLKNVLEGTPI